MAKLLKTKETKKYIFTIHRVVEVEISEQEKWNMKNGFGRIDEAPDFRKEDVWEGEYEIKDETVIDILKVLLKQNNDKSN